MECLDSSHPSLNSFHSSSCLQHASYPQCWNSVFKPPPPSKIIMHSPHAYTVLQLWQPPLTIRHCIFPLHLPPFGSALPTSCVQGMVSWWQVWLVGHSFTSQARLLLLIGRSLHQCVQTSQLTLHCKIGWLLAYLYSWVNLLQRWRLSIINLWWILVCHIQQF